MHIPAGKSPFIYPEAGQISIWCYGWWDSCWSHARLLYCPFLFKVKRIGFSTSSSRCQFPAVYQWLVRFKGLLVAKFGLYFFDVLSRHGPANEVKNLMAKASIDFYTRYVYAQCCHLLKNYSLAATLKHLYPKLLPADFYPIDKALTWCYTIWIS